ncbi:MAG: DUF5688 family protein [Ruminococcus sp.]|nr:MULTISPECIES: DUF5688 family protein [Clostridia]MCB5419995.1 DUF5688 family protein [Blautia luti]MCB5385744.1 DUF5688 family protein [Blautia glucerasea]MCB6331377.1 DUF5688 family protein [Blautia faecis]MCB6627471.1 DUF5688 family protein [Blautia sp. 210702-DFI.1.159]MDB8774010.1 DUF5688 family protein [Ruminococcus sp. 1001136sp1]
MKLGYLEFVEVLRKQLLNALHLQEQQIFFKKKAIDNKDRLFVEAFENSSGKQLCGIDVKDLYERCMEGSSMESISYSVQDEIEKLKTVGMLEGEMTPDSYQKIRKYLFVKPLNKKAHSLELEDAVHKDVGDIACVVYMMLSNTNEYFCVKIKNQHLKQWKMTKEAVMEEALKNTCQMTPPFIYTNGKNKSGGSFMDNGAFCLSKSDKVMGVQLCTNAKENGAVSVFFPGVLQRLAQLMESDLYILFTSRNESSIYSVNESNLEDIKDELHIMETDYDNGIWYEDSLSEELYYYSRIEDKLSVYMEKVKVNFTTVNLKEAH